MINDDFSFNDFFYWEEQVLSLRNMGLMKQLRTFEKSIQDKLTELEREPLLNRELIIQEKAILEATQKEIRRLERKAFYAQFGE